MERRSSIDEISNVLLDKVVDNKWVLTPFLNYHTSYLQEFKHKSISIYLKQPFFFFKIINLT